MRRILSRVLKALLHRLLVLARSLWTPKGHLTILPISFDRVTDTYRRLYAAWLGGISSPAMPLYVAAGTHALDIDSYQETFSDYDLDHRWLRARGGWETPPGETPSATIEETESLSIALSSPAIPRTLAGLISATTYKLDACDLTLRFSALDSDQSGMMLALVDGDGFLSGDASYTGYYLLVLGPNAGTGLSSVSMRGAQGGASVLAQVTSLATPPTSLRITISAGLISFYADGVLLYASAYAITQRDLCIALLSTAESASVQSTITGFSSVCTGSLDGATVLPGEVARVQASIRDAYLLGEEPIAYFSAEFDRGVGSGVWRTIALLNDNAITRIVNDTESEIPWETNPSNDLYPEIEDYQIGTGCIRVEGSAAQRFYSDWLQGPTGFYDIFTDGEIGDSWQQGKSDPAVTLIEQNGRLEITTTDGESGHVTLLTMFPPSEDWECSVDVLMNKASRKGLYLTDSQPSPTGAPEDLPSYYAIVKDQRYPSSEIRVLRRIAGQAEETLYSEAWNSETLSTLGIKLSGDDISFHHDGQEVYSQHYAFGSMAHVSLGSLSELGLSQYGMDAFDHFASSITPALDESCYLQFHYALSDKSLIPYSDALGTQPELTVRLGPDPLNYWEYRVHYNGLEEGWTFLSFRISDYYSITGSPSLTTGLLHYFELLYSDDLEASLTDRLDFIRVMKDNGDVYCISELTAANRKALAESRHVIWRNTVTGTE